MKTNVVSLVKEKNRVRAKVYRMTNPITRMLTMAHTRSKKMGFPSDLTREWLDEKLAKGCCEVTGLKFELLFGEKSPYLPSIDRIDSSKGYTQDNCQLVCWIYNRAKGVDTDADVLVLAKAIVEHNAAKRGIDEKG